MVSIFKISFLCCVALAAAVPDPTLIKQERIPSKDFDIIVVTINEPISGESNGTDRAAAFYDDIFDQLFFNFQLPAFPGFRQMFSEEDLSSEETAFPPERMAEKLVKPEVVTVSPAVESTTQYVVQRPVNFGLTSLFSSVLNNMLTGLSETMNQYKDVIPDEKLDQPKAEFLVAEPEVVKPEIAKPEVVRPEVAKPEVVKQEIVKPEVAKPEIEHKVAKSDKPNFRILFDEPDMAEASEIEKKIERLFLENNEKDNDLKHGGVKRSPEHEHEFHSVPEKKTEEIPSSKSEEPTTTELSQEEFDKIIMELLSSYEDGLPTAHVVEKPETDVSSLSSEKPDRSVESSEETNPISEMIHRFAQEPLMFDDSTEAPALLDEKAESATETVPIFGEDSEESTESVESTENVYTYMVPQDSEESSEFFGSEGYVFVPRFEESARYEVPLMTAEFILIPSSSPKPSRKSHQNYHLGRNYPTVINIDYPEIEYVPGYGHDYSMVQHVPDFADYPSVPTYTVSYNYPVMGAYPHPYAHHFWPQPQAHPFDFMGYRRDYL